jgi:hypothetical protein
MQTLHKINQNLIKSILVTVACVALLMASIMVFEPALGMAVTDTFTIQQTVSSEISFLVPAADVTMAGALAGITGGTATGTTFAVVRTNNNSGYTMDIAFSTSTALRGNTTNSQSIRDYVTVEPTYAFTASSAALFAYTVSASTTTDVDQSFLNDGSNCNTGSSSTLDTCWMGASTTNFRIVSRATEAGTGATTTIKFKVHIPGTASPAVTEDTYTATATLTALVQ